MSASRPALPFEPGTSLPELESVSWRRPMDDAGLHMREWVSAGYTTVYCTPLVAAGLILIALEPLLVPVALIAWLHAWVIPELFAHRGARVVLPAEDAVGARSGGTPRTLKSRSVASGVPPTVPRRDGTIDPDAELLAQGFLADLLGHRERELQRETGLALERGRLGVWLVGEAGALLVRPGGRRVHCFCARTTEPGLPRCDRIAHLLLALRQDETGFATVANHAFTGAAWRVRRRLPAGQRPALEEARLQARDARC